MGSNFDNLLKDFRSAVGTIGEKTSPYDTSAKVTRIEGDTAWVHIPGGVDETPVKLTVDAKQGDEVQVRVSGGRAFLVGNASAPPTDDTTAKAADVKAKVADVKATAAKVEAGVAKETAVVADTKATDAKETAEAILIFDTSHSISNGVASFVPHVYLKGEEVTTNYAVSCFVWKYRLIDGSEVTLTTKSNRGCDVNISLMGYGGHVIGLFTPPA